MGRPRAPQIPSGAAVLQDLDEHSQLSSVDEGGQPRRQPKNSSGKKRKYSEYLGNQQRAMQQLGEQPKRQNTQKNYDLRKVKTPLGPSARGGSVDKVQKGVGKNESFKASQFAIPTNQQLLAAAKATNSASKGPAAMDLGKDGHQ